LSAALKDSLEGVGNALQKTVERMGGEWKTCRAGVVGAVKQAGAAPILLAREERVRLASASLMHTGQYVCASIVLLPFGAVQCLLVLVLSCFCALLFLSCIVCVVSLFLSCFAFAKLAIVLCGAVWWWRCSTMDCHVSFC